LGTRTGINIEVTAQDASSTTIDQTSFFIKSSATDTYGIIVWCMETGTNTGIYRAEAHIRTKSDWLNSFIGLLRQGDPGFLSGFTPRKGIIWDG